MSRARPDYSPRREDSMKGIGQTQNSVMLDVELCRAGFHNEHKYYTDLFFWLREQFSSK